jgi:CheY-like chemotaxis protein
MASAHVILVAEDNDDDFVLLRCAFESAGLPHRLIGVGNGVDAVDYLFAEVPYTNRSAYPFPDLLLLDLHMPVMDGFEVLAALKGRSQFRCLPIVVLSSVDDPLFIQEALKLGATDFLIKSISMADRVEMAQGLHSRWLKGEKRAAGSWRNFNTWSFPQSTLDVSKPKNQQVYRA